MIEQYHGNDCEWAIWQVDEPEDWLLEQARLTQFEWMELERMKGNRRKEFLSGRMLLGHVGDGLRNFHCHKDEYGKPHLQGHPWHISFSHSFQYSATIAGPGRVGIDLEVIHPRVLKIADKFLRPEEKANWVAQGASLEQLLCIWGSKEALYKMWGKRGLDWKDHIVVPPFTFVPGNGSFTGYVHKHDLRMNAAIHYKVMDPLICIWAVEG